MCTDRKVCAIGVRAKKFIVYHGLAFNVKVDKNYFNLINPCGITDYDICSMNDVVDSPDMEAVKSEVIHQFESHFDINYTPLTVEALLQK